MNLRKEKLGKSYHLYFLPIYCKIGIILNKLVEYICMHSNIWLMLKK